MSMLKNPDFTEDLGKLIRDQKHQDGATDSISSDLEKELNIYRSGSAPPTVEGSLNSIGGLFNSKGGILSEEELRADPAYVNYYYSNGNLNPRLPPPLLSREDWRFAQRLQGGNGNNGNNGSDENRSLFAVQPGFGEEEENGGGGSGVKWGGGDGLIGLPGLGGLGTRQKSIAEIFQVMTRYILTLFLSLLWIDSVCFSLILIRFSTVSELSMLFWFLFLKLVMF